MRLINKFIIIYREYIKRAFVTIMLMFICVISLLYDRQDMEYIYEEQM